MPQGRAAPAVKSAAALTVIARTIRYDQPERRSEVTVRPFTDPHTGLSRFARITEADTTDFTTYPDALTALEAYASVVHRAEALAAAAGRHAWHHTDLHIPTDPPPRWASTRPPPASPVVLRIPAIAAAAGRTAADDYPVGARVVYRGILTEHHGPAVVTACDPASGTVDLLTDRLVELAHVSAAALARLDL